jgi:transposase
MIGALRPVRVPTPAEEAMRDLVRAREDVRGDLMCVRHRVAKLLLRGSLALPPGPAQRLRAAP